MKTVTGKKQEPKNGPKKEESRPSVVSRGPGKG